MRDGDIRAGVTYGVAPRWQDKPDPTVVLQNRPRSVFVRHADGIQLAPEQDGRLRVGSSTGAGARGYAAVTGPADSLEGLGCAAELGRLRQGLEPSRPGLKWALITELRKVIGPYPDAIRAYQDKQSSVMAAVDGRRAVVDAAIGELTALGATGVLPGYHNATVTLPAAEARRLLARPSGPGPYERGRELADAAAGPTSQDGLRAGETVSARGAVDDRDYPGGESFDARLMRWLVDERTDPRIRSEGTEPVTLTGGQVFDLLLEATDRAYRNAVADIQGSGQRDTGPDILNLGFPVKSPLDGARPMTRQRPGQSSKAPGGQPGVPKGTGFAR